MGSYGRGVLLCEYCARRGQCFGGKKDPGMASLVDVDGIGVLCNPCYYRGPPHFDYLSKVLAAKFGINIVTDDIATFAYEVCCEFVDRRHGYTTVSLWPQSVTNATHRTHGSAHTQPY